jgi:hypothetical protein
LNAAIFSTLKEPSSGEGVLLTIYVIEYLVEKLKGRCHLEHLDIGGRIILKWILKGTQQT